MSQINLIPEKRKTSGVSSPLSRNLQKVSFVLVAIFVISIVAGGVFLFINSQTLQKETARYEQLKHEVTLLQGNEERLILLRDRLDKAQNILLDRDQYKALAYFVDFTDGFPEGVTISEISVEKGINKLTLSVNNSKTLAAVMDQIQASTEYQNITVDSITYSPLLGYVLSISVL